MPEPFCVIPWHKGRFREIRVYLDPVPDDDARAAALSDLQGMAREARDGEVPYYAEQLAKRRGWQVISVVTDPDHADPFGELVSVGFRTDVNLIG